MEQRRVAAVVQVKLTRGAKGEYRWEVESAATKPELAVRDVLAMDMLLTEEYYPDELEFQSEIMSRIAKEERDADQGN